MNLSPEKMVEIIDLYSRHGWMLRRLLLPASSTALANAIRSGVPVDDFEIEAAWFSREPRPGAAVAWELRYLGDPPFAMLENFCEDHSDFSAKRNDLETRLKEAVRGRLDKR